MYEWLLLAGLVGVIGGLGAVGFKWLTDDRRDVLAAYRRRLAELRA